MNLICFTETWLKDGIQDIDISGYTMIRADRNVAASQKTVGGGLCIYVDNRWATRFRICEQVCTPDYELLSVAFRPFYLLREFGQITIILVYVPGPDHVKAGNKIAECFNEALAHSPEQPVLILGDMNSCDLSTFLPALHQYVDCPTRLSRILDKCYGNIAEGYKAICRTTILYIYFPDIGL